MKAVALFAGAAVVMLACGGIAQSIYDEKTLTIQTPAYTTLTITGKNGKQAVIDFGGDKVEYRGDMPVDEAAQMFFEQFFNNCRRRQP